VGARAQAAHRLRAANDGLRVVDMFSCGTLDWHDS
jgi:hypothetical protein